MILEILSQTVFGITFKRIIVALGIIICSLIIGKSIYYFFRTFGRKITAKTKSELDDILIDVIEGPVIAITFLIGLYIAFNLLKKDLIIDPAFTAVFKVAVIAVLAWAALRVTDSFIKKLLVPLTKKTKSAFDDQMIPLFSKGAKAIIGIIALVMVLDSVGFNVTALLAGLGIGGLALAFAAQETISNVFGGVSLLLDKSFKIGDKLKLDSGEIGVVHEIGLRSTRIRTYSNEIIIIPNAIMAKSKIINFVQPDAFRRGEVKFGTVYGTDIDKVQKAVIEAMKRHPKVSKKIEPTVDFIQMADSSLNFSAKFWCDDFTDVWQTEREMTKEIYDTLNKNKIGIPFPTQTVYLKK